MSASIATNSPLVSCRVGLKQIGAAAATELVHNCGWRRAEQLLLDQSAGPFAHSASCKRHRYLDTLNRAHLVTEDGIVLAKPPTFNGADQSDTFVPIMYGLSPSKPTRACIPATELAATNHAVRSASMP